MSRQLRFSALRRSVFQGAADIRRQNCRHHLRYLLFVWSIILTLLLALVILSLAIFVYLVPCPVWSAGNGGEGRGRLVVIGNSSNSTAAHEQEENVQDYLTTSLPLPSSPSAFSSFFSSNFYTWKCPVQALYYVPDEYSTTPETASPENETTNAEKAAEMKRL